LEQYLSSFDQWKDESEWMIQNEDAMIDDHPHSQRPTRQSRRASIIIHVTINSVDPG
jgi:hypothetical protein